MKSWYLLMTKPKQDEVAEQNLANQGFEVYRPLNKVVRKRQSKQVAVLESLFPRYLFIKLDTNNQNWSPIRSTKGVLHLIRFGNKPAIVQPEIIDLVKQQEECLLQAEQKPAYQQGERLRVESGPFYGMDVVFLHEDAEQRVFAFLNVLGQNQVVRFDPEQVVKTD